MERSKFKLILGSFRLIECREFRMEQALEEIKFSKNCLVVYAPTEGQIEVLFTGYNEELLHTLIVAMCSHKNFQNFIKLASNAADEIKRGNKKAMDFIHLAEVYINNKLNDLDND